MHGKSGGGKKPCQRGRKTVVFRVIEGGKKPSRGKGKEEWRLLVREKKKEAWKKRDHNKEIKIRKSIWRRKRGDRDESERREKRRPSLGKVQLKNVQPEREWEGPLLPRRGT